MSFFGLTIYLSKIFRSSFFSRATFGKPFEGSKANDGTE